MLLVVAYSLPEYEVAGVDIRVAGWFFSLLIGLALNIIAYLLLPRPKGPKPPEVQDLERPTAEAGRPIPVLFGTLIIKGGNWLWSGDFTQHTYEISV